MDSGQTAKLRTQLPRLRLVSWIVLGLSLVLPFARGCEGELVYAYKYAASKDFLLFGLPFVYPVFVWLIGTKIRRWWDQPDGSLRHLRMQRICLAQVALLLAAALHWLIVLRSEWLAVREGLFIFFLLGLFAYALAEGRLLRSSEAGVVSSSWLVRTITAQLALYSSGTLFYLCDMVGWDALLVGGWLALAGSFTASFVAVFEYMTNRESGAVQGPA